MARRSRVHAAESSSSEFSGAWPVPGVLRLNGRNGVLQRTIERTSVLEAVSPILVVMAVAPELNCQHVVLRAACIGLASNLGPTTPLPAMRPPARELRGGKVAGANTVVLVGQGTPVRRHRGRNGFFARFATHYAALGTTLVSRRAVVASVYVVVAVLLVLTEGRELGTEIFPRVDASQMQVRLRAPAGTQVEGTEKITLRVIDLIEEEAGGADKVKLTLGLVGVHVPNYPINLVYQWNGGSHEGVLQVQFKVGSGLDMESLKKRLRARFVRELPAVSFSFELSDIVSRVMSMGAPTPIEVVVGGANLADDLAFAEKLRGVLAKESALRDVQFGQTLDYPTLNVNVDREHSLFHCLHGGMNLSPENVRQEARVGLIVVAMSRISMRIVNAAIEERIGDTATNVATSVEYRARPPRRNLAIFCIGTYTLAELFAPGARIGGWLALAAAAALLNLLNDWHVGRALLRRWPLMLYGVYVLMAGGYALMGAAIVLEAGFFSAGRHLAAVGAMGLAIYAVLCIAGRMHCGLPLDERLWVPTGAWLIVAGALTRAATSLPGAPAALLGLSGLLWGTAFALYVWRMAPLLLAPRADGGSGCEGILAEKHAVS